MDLKIPGFKGYELVDSGDGRKLERVGGVLMNRPAPQAIWPANQNADWRQSQTIFNRGQGGTGHWEPQSQGLPQTWQAVWNDLTFEIRPTGFGNVGLFPEHTAHWTWMADQISRIEAPEVLNLFAYTGGASMVSARAGAQVTHVDAAKSVNGWAILNAERSKINNKAIRFLADDVLKFTKREKRRNKRYHGIIIDPPSFGRGTKGEVWKIERDLHLLLTLCHTLLVPQPLFVLLTSHSPGITPSVLSSLLSPFGNTVESGEMLLVGGGPPLPQGAYARWTPISK